MSLPPFLVIEGNIGAGKTTLSTRLSQQFNRRLILEEFEDNPFLPLFYQEPDRYAFPVELFFMAERHKQLQHELANRELFTQGTIADYLFIKTLLFARTSLTQQEFRLFGRLFRAMDAHFPKPDLIVYLRRPIEALQENIARRGRSYEGNIQNDYLLSVERAYLSYFNTLKEIPVVILDVGYTDFAASDSAYGDIVALLTAPHGPGVHRYSVEDQPIFPKEGQDIARTTSW